MKRFYVLLLGLVCTSVSMSQSYEIGRQSLTIVDEQRSNRSISTEIYYPATTSGNNTAIAPGTEKFPVIVFGHGFLIGTGSYKWLGDALARQGFIAAFPNTEGTITPNHNAFGKDLSVVVSKLIASNVDPASPFFGRVLNKGAVGGHSMGGGASFLAAASGNADIQLLFNFAAAETNPSSITAGLSVNMPSLIISGSRDCIAAPQSQLAMFNNIPATNCKAYVNITDALHCHFADNNFVCAAGQLLTGCNSSPQSAGQTIEKTLSLLVPFLNYHLKNICVQGELFEANFNNMAATSKILECAPFPSCGILPVKLVSFSGVSNAQVNILTWKTDEEMNLKNFELQRSADGQNFTIISTIPATAVNSGGQSYSTTDEFPFSGNNLYRLKLVDRDNSFEYSETINIRSEAKKLSISGMYPNPVRNVLQVNLQAFRNISTQIQIIDGAGKTVFSKSFMVQEGESTIQIDAKRFHPGVYILLLKSSNEEVSGRYKFVKF